MKTIVLLLLFITSAEAGQRKVRIVPDCSVTKLRQCMAPSVRGEKVVKAMGGFGFAKKVYRP